MYPSTPVYAVTGYANQYDVKHFGEAGFNGFISKPIDVDILLEIVRKHEPA